MTMLRTRLAYAFQCSPTALRDLTVGEGRAMLAVLAEVHEAHKRARRK